MENKAWIITGVSVVAFAAALLVFDALSSVESSPPTHEFTIGKSEHESHEHHTQSDHTHKHDAHPSHHASTETDSNQPVTTTLVSPLPISVDIDRDKAKLGWMLFKDPNLSSNGRVSCETCHSLQTDGAEEIPVSVGVGGQGTRNSLTVFNVAYNYRFFWDGRENRLERQIDGPINNIVEMDTTWENVVDYVSQSKRYSAIFNELKIEVNEHTIKHVITEFMASLVTPNSKFDQYLNGDQSALTATEKRGWDAFKSNGCVTCHRGVNVGGGMVMRFGYFGENTMGETRSNDKGRFETTSQKEDEFLFRVASLRNVGLTSPYFHDGKTNDLKEAIKIMGQSQLGRNLSDETVDEIFAFLHTLTGQRPHILEEFENE